MELLESLVGGPASVTVANRARDNYMTGVSSRYYTRSKDIYRVGAQNHHTVPTNTLKHYMQAQRVSASV